MDPNVVGSVRNILSDLQTFLCPAFQSDTWQSRQQYFAPHPPHPLKVVLAVRVVEVVGGLLLVVVVVVEVSLFSRGSSFLQLDQLRQRRVKWGGFGTWRSRSSSANHPYACLPSRGLGSVINGGTRPAVML